MDNLRPNPIPIDSAVQAEVVRSLAAKLQACYIFPKTAEQISACLQAHLEAGEYAGLTEGELFAMALTLHLQEISQDRHLEVHWSPEPLPEVAGPLTQHPDLQAQRLQQARRDNFGLHRAERLPGNVGILDIRSFANAEIGGDTAVAAMNFLANTDALIVDLRQCLGGDPDMIALICTYFFSAERVHLNSLYWREEDFTQQFWTLPHVPGQRYVEKPVFVLISKITFSGGEEFAYNLQTRRRALLVGENTGGGAHPGSYYRLHPHFEAFVPSGRAINPVTGANWEGAGVTPDVSVPPDQALPVAYHLALEAILAGLGEPPATALRPFAEEIRAALKTVHLG